MSVLIGSRTKASSFKTLELGTTVRAQQKAVVTIGTDAYTADAVKALTGFTIAESPASGDKAVDAMVSGTVNNAIVVDASDIIKGVVQADIQYVSVNHINKNSLLVLDALTADRTGERAVFGESLTLAQGSVLYLDNAANGQAIKMSASDFNDNGANVVYEGDLLLNVDRKANTNLLVVGIEDKAEVVDKLGDVAGLDAIYGMYEKGENVGNANAKFFRDLMSSQTSSAYDKTTGEWNFQTIRTTLNDVAAIGATTGAQAVTMDAVNQMADTVAARTSILTQRAQGVNVWVDVNGGRFEGKKVMDGAGYSSDIYAGTLGADYQFANGAVLGAALTIGTADTDSKGTTTKTSMDSDLVGFSVYGTSPAISATSRPPTTSRNRATASATSLKTSMPSRSACAVKCSPRPVRSTSFRTWVCATRVSPPTASRPASTPKSTIRTSSRCLSA